MENLMNILLKCMIELETPIIILGNLLILNSHIKSGNIHKITFLMAYLNQWNGSWVPADN